MELKSDSSKIVGNKIAIQKSVAFLYTSNDKWKLKLKTQYHWKNVYSGLLPILWLICLFLILCCMSCLYIFNINQLLVILFANSFFYSEGCLLILLMVSFTVLKLLSLIRFHLFVFAFISFALGDRSKKVLLWFMSKNVLPTFSSLYVIAYFVAN